MKFENAQVSQTCHLSGYHGWAVIVNGNTMIYLGSYKADTDPEKRTAQRDALFAEKGITVLSEWTPVQAAWWLVDLDIPEGLVPKR